MKIAAFLLLVLALSGCVAGSEDSARAASGGGLTLFLLGLWHGVIGPLTLTGEAIGRLFPGLLPRRLQLYEVKATGSAYNLGFHLGLAGGPFLAFGQWT